MTRYCEHSGVELPPEAPCAGCEGLRAQLEVAREALSDSIECMEVAYDDMWNCYEHKCVPIEACIMAADKPNHSRTGCEAEGDVFERATMASVVGRGVGL